MPQFHLPISPLQVPTQHISPRPQGSLGCGNSTGLATASHAGRTTAPAPWGPSAEGEHCVSLLARREGGGQACEGHGGDGAWSAESSPATHVPGSLCNTWAKREGEARGGDKPRGPLSAAGPNLVTRGRCLVPIFHPGHHPPDANSGLQPPSSGGPWPGALTGPGLAAPALPAPPLTPRLHTVSACSSPLPRPHSQPPARGGSVVLTALGSGTPPRCRCPGTGVRLFWELAAPLGLSREPWRERWKPTGVRLSGRGRVAAGLDWAVRTQRTAPTSWCLGETRAGLGGSLAVLGLRPPERALEWGQIQLALPWGGDTGGSSRGPRLSVS